MLLAACCFLAHAAARQSAPIVVPLWEHGAPGFEKLRDVPEIAKDYYVRNINNPSLTVYMPPPQLANGTAILIAPGGGHSLLVFDAEGRDPAQYLNRLGITCFVLKYRLGREQNSPYKIEIHAKQDAYRAMRLIRSRADEWHIDPSRVGFLGFSAGGEVVSMVGFAPGDGDPNAADPVDRANGRPDFLMEVYPGPLGVPNVVPSDAPPMFMVVANDDDGHSGVVLDLLSKYRMAKASVEAHILGGGGHGYNMGQRSNLIAVRDWPHLMTDWLLDHGLLKPP